MYYVFCIPRYVTARCYLFLYHTAVTRISESAAHLLPGIEFNYKPPLLIAMTHGTSKDVFAILNTAEEKQNERLLRLRRWEISIQKRTVNPRDCLRRLLNKVLTACGKRQIEYNHRLSALENKGHLISNVTDVIKKGTINPRNEARLSPAHRGRKILRAVVMACRRRRVEHNHRLLMMEDKAYSISLTMKHVEDDIYTNKRKDIRRGSPSAIEAKQKERERRLREINGIIRRPTMNPRNETRVSPIHRVRSIANAVFKATNEAQIERNHRLPTLEDKVNSAKRVMGMGMNCTILRIAEMKQKERTRRFKEINKSIQKRIIIPKKEIQICPIYNARVMANTVLKATRKIRTEHNHQLSTIEDKACSISLAMSMDTKDIILDVVQSKQNERKRLLKEIVDAIKKRTIRPRNEARVRPLRRGRSTLGAVVMACRRRQVEHNRQLLMVEDKSYSISLAMSMDIKSTILHIIGTKQNERALRLEEIMRCNVSVMVKEGMLMRNTLETIGRNVRTRNLRLGNLEELMSDQARRTRYLKSDCLNFQRRLWRISGRRLKRKREWLGCGRDIDEFGASMRKVFLDSVGNISFFHGDRTLYLTEGNSIENDVLKTLWTQTSLRTFSNFSKECAKLTNGAFQHIIKDILREEEKPRKIYNIRLWDMKPLFHIMGLNNDDLKQYVVRKAGPSHHPTLPCIQIIGAYGPSGEARVLEVASSMTYIQDPCVFSSGDWNIGFRSISPLQETGSRKDADSLTVERFNVSRKRDNHGGLEIIWTETGIQTGTKGDALERFGTVHLEIPIVRVRSPICISSLLESIRRKFMYEPR